MFMRMRREVPQGLTDEGRWYKYFSIRSLIVALCMAGVGILIGKLISGLGITLYFIVLWFVLTGVVTALTLIRIPNRNWLSGGGEYIDQLIFKRIIRRMNKCLYIKGYNQTFYEERNREAFEANKGEK